MSRGETSTEAIRHYYRGRVFEATGELDIAIEEYKKAIEYGADYADVHNALGRALAKKGFLEEARIEFETALRLNPRYLEAQRNLNELITKMSLAKQKQTVTTTTQLVEPSLQQTIPQGAQVETVSEEKLYYERLYRYKIIKTLLSCGATFLLLVILTVLVYKKFTKVPLPIQKTYSTQLESISSITRFNNKLVLSCWSTQEIVFYKVYENDLVMFTLVKLDKENIIPTSISLLNDTLYVMDGWNRKLYRYLVVNNKLSLMKVLDISETEPVGIATYKNLVLLFDNKNASVMVYNRELTKLVDVVPYVVKNIIVVSSYKNSIWLLDKNYMLYKLENLTQVSKTYRLDFVVGKTISSIFLDNKLFWFAEEGKPYLYCYSKSILE